MQKLVKTDKNTEMNKQSDVKFWLIKLAVSYSLNCIISTKNATFYYVKIKNNHQEGKWKKIVHFGKSQGLICHFNGGYLVPLLP